MQQFEKAVSSLWAKKEESGSRLYWLPLTVHLSDAMYVAKWLWINWLSDSQRKFCVRSIKPADEEAAIKLAAFLGAIHDIGKATPAFQIQKAYRNSPDLDDILIEKLEESGFHGISYLELTEPKKTHHSLAGEYLLQKKFHVRSDIGSVIGSHHGKPADSELDIDNQTSYEKNYFQSEDPDSEIWKLWENVQSSIFQQALKKSGFDSADDLPELSLPAQALYSGLLIMADWISSNSGYFPLIPINSDQIPDPQKRLKNGIQKWGENLPLQIDSLFPVNDLYHNRFGYAPREFQKMFYQTVSRIRHPGIIILEAPMGLGKTEAALAAAEEVACKTGSSGLFFGLPTQATSNSMFGRVHTWLESILNDYPGASQLLKLYHSKAALNDEMNSIKEASNINVDDAENGGIYVNEWFSGSKKTALNDFVVGTVDGFLLTALKQKHLALRHLGFSKKVVIVDEVHAYDAYMQEYLEEAIEWMGAYGASVILLSATLPNEKRKDLITAYLRGWDIKKRDMEFPKEMFGNYYPMISFTDGKDIKVQTNRTAEKNKIVHIERLEESEILDKISELLNGGGVIGIIVNTVERAQRLGKACKDRFGNDMVDILHSAFIATDRVRKETALMSMIGRNGKRPDKKIIIGTQVIEQSLDIDFDVLITDLCPMDLLLQRIGRLHRHVMVRPVIHKDPVVYVMGMNDQMKFEKGSEFIYEAYFLIRTQCFLPDKINIPSDIPVLVNKVYGDETLELPGQLMNRYFESQSQMKIHKECKARKAQSYRIDDPRSKIDPENERYNLLGKLKNPNQSQSEEMAVAQVRDIQETVEVIALQKAGEGYGTFENNRDISGNINDPNIAKMVARETVRLPQYVIHNGITGTIEWLEKYANKHFASWQNQPWLKSELGIVFDENGRAELNGIQLKYDHDYGLRKVEEDGKI